MRTRLLHEPARLAGSSLLRLQSDERLTALALAGHDPAFTAIVVRYRAPLTRYCAGIVGADRAEDVVQQTLINAHAALTKSSDVRHLRSWLYRIAHNTALNALRAVRDDLPLEHALATADGPEAALERSEHLRATLAALDQLPERQRAALLLRELEGRSHEEIAAVLGVTAGSARQHLMRARASLRTAVTAITPYPLVARLAEAMTAGPPQWTDAVAGAGVGATIAKLTAGVAATGALVGGVVGPGHVVGTREPTATAAREAAARGPAKIVRAIPAAAAPIVPGAAAPGGGAVSEPAVSRTGTTTHRRTAARTDHSRKGSGDDGGSRGTAPGVPDDHSGSGDEHDGGRSGSSGSGSGSGEDGRRSGSSGSGSSGSGDDGERDRRDRSGSSGSGSGSSGSGSGSSSHDGSGDGDPVEIEKSGSSGSGSSGSGSGRAPETEAPEDPPPSGSPEDSASKGPGSGSDHLPDTPTVPSPPPPPSPGD